jgi:hypothetical protein
MVRIGGCRRAQVIDNPAGTASALSWTTAPTPT